jgi:hypothetical protein
VREIARVLMPGGALLLAVHEGAGEVAREELFDTPVDFVATLFVEDPCRRGAGTATPRPCRRRQMRRALSSGT